MKRLILALALTLVPSLTLAYSIEILDYPFTWRTGISDINNNGVMVGTFGTFNGSAGFIYDSDWTVLEYPGAHLTGTGRINDQGKVFGVGYDSVNHHYMWDGSFHELFPPAHDPDYACIYLDTHYEVFRIPDTISTSAGDFNSLGQIVGTYRTTEGYFGYVKTGNQYETLAPPWAGWTHAHGINDLGHVVGAWGDNKGGYGAWFYDGKYHNLGTDTEAFGINNHDTIVGKLDEGSLEHGFIIRMQSVPAPASIFLLGIGLLALAGFRRKFKE